MKIIIGLLLSMFVYADTLLVIDAKGDESKKTFLKIEGDKCYYKNAYQNAANCYRQTGNILIKFNALKDLNFLQKYGLIYIKDVNSYNKTLLYQPSNNLVNIITLVNKINKENSNLRARVEWITPRRLF